MNGENNDEKIEGEEKDDFGRVIDTLHNKSKLPSLRTYQGDMAEFIKEKNESVLSIAVKEKIRKDERKEQEEKQEKEEVKEINIEQKQDLEPQIIHKNKPQNGLQVNLTMILLSLFLIVGGITAVFYIFNLLKSGPVDQTILMNDIIPYNSVSTLANVSNLNLKDQLIKLPVANGINIIKISDTNGVSFLKAKDFFSFLKISLSSELLRTLKDDYVLGSISQNGKNLYFLIITVNDFGVAFSAMLDWETIMVNDLSFLEGDLQNKDSFSWRDIIIKNKDTRALVNDAEKSQIAYTFLDKNTILIVGDLSIIGDISSAFASRRVAR